MDFCKGQKYWTYSGTRTPRPLNWRTSTLASQDRGFGFDSGIDLDLYISIYIYIYIYLYLYISIVIGNFEYGKAGLIGEDVSSS